MQKPKNHYTPVILESKNQAEKDVDERENGRKNPIEPKNLATFHLLLIIKPNRELNLCLISRAVCRIALNMDKVILNYSC